jgi:Holliday junction resolvase RusA-like endonuclease
MVLHTFKIEKIKSKPTGIPGVTKQGKPFITFGADYMNWKADQVGVVYHQKQPGIEYPLTPIMGAYFRLVLPPTHRGHLPDLYNLVGSFADILTQADVWRDDCVAVSDCCTIRVLYNTTRISSVQLFTTRSEYSTALRLLADSLDFSPPD